MSVWDDLGRLAARLGTGETEEERRAREEREAWERYVRENNILSEPILVRDEIERYEREAGILPKESFADRMRKHGNPDRSLLEDRRGEAVRTDSAGLEVPVGAPEGRPRGSGSVLDPQWIDHQNRIRLGLPPSVQQDLEEADEFTALRDERGDLVDGRFERTRSPLVLRKRNANGTVTYVHALTGQPLFTLGEYGLNDPQGSDGPGKAFDPYWREGRRDW